MKKIYILALILFLFVGYSMSQEKNTSRTKLYEKILSKDNEKYLIGNIEDSNLTLEERKLFYTALDYCFNEKETLYGKTVRQIIDEVRKQEQTKDTIYKSALKNVSPTYESSEYNFQINIVDGWEVMPQPSTPLSILVNKDNPDSMIVIITDQEHLRFLDPNTSYTMLSKKEREYFDESVVDALKERYRNANIQPMRYNTFNNYPATVVTYSYFSSDDDDYVNGLLITFLEKSTIYAFAVETTDDTGEHFSQLLKMCDSFKVTQPNYPSQL